MAASKAQYPGRCMLCDEVLNKGQMLRHVRRCVEREAAGRGRSRKLLHLVIEGRYLTMYWIHVEAPGSSTLWELDAFLRKIWLECCGHMSCFTINGECYSVSPSDDSLFGGREKSMSCKIAKVLDAGMTFLHEYDFGSTTELKLRVAGVRDAPAKKADVRLLARNEPPPLKCAKCGAPAARVQATGWGVEPESLFCIECMDVDSDEGYLPVVNSPRVGVCGYSG